MQSRPHNASRHARSPASASNSSPSGFLYACAACSVSEFALHEAGRCLVHDPQDRLQLRAQCSRRRLPLLIPQFRPFISPSSIPSVLAAAPLPLGPLPLPPGPLNAKHSKRAHGAVFNGTHRHDRTEPSSPPPGSPLRAGGHRTGRGPPRPVPASHD